MLSHLNDVTNCVLLINLRQTIRAHGMHLGQRAPPEDVKCQPCPAYWVILSSVLLLLIQITGITTDLLTPKYNVSRHNNTTRQHTVQQVRRLNANQLPAEGCERYGYSGINLLARGAVKIKNKFQYRRFAQ